MAAMIAPTVPHKSERQHQLGQLDGKQRRDIAPRHVDDRDQLTIEQLAPGFFRRNWKK